MAEHKAQLAKKDEELDALNEQVFKKQSLEEKIRNLESKLATSRELVKELEEAKKLIKELQFNLSQVSQQKEQQVHKNEQYKDELQSTKDHLSEKVLKIRSLEGENSLLKDELYQMKKSVIDKKEENLRNQTRELELLQRQVESLKENFKGSSSTKSVYEEREKLIVDLEDRIKSLQNENHQLRYRQEQAEGQLRTIQNKLHELDSQNGNLQEQYQNLKRANKTLEDRLTMANLEVEKYKMQNQQERDKTRASESQVFEARKERLGFTERISQLEEKLSEERKVNEKLVADVSKARADLQQREISEQTFKEQLVESKQLLSQMDQEVRELKNLQSGCQQYL